jgi:formiminotetrahydrofolate cyclodeaminase
MEGGATAGRPEAASYADHDLGGFLDLVATRSPAAGGGPVAAITVAMAAGLTAMAARFSGRSLPDGEQLADTADQLRRRAIRLADDDTAAYRDVMAAMAAGGSEGGKSGGGGPAGGDSGEPQGSDRRLRDALTRASEVPLEVCEVAAETARLAALLVEGGNPRLRGDALTAVLLAEAAARAAADLVRINVESGGCDEELIRSADRSADNARTARARVCDPR